jgi:hypothetical protein
MYWLERDTLPAHLPSPNASERAPAKTCPALSEDHEYTWIYRPAQVQRLQQSESETTTREFCSRACWLDIGKPPESVCMCDHTP